MTDYVAHFWTPGYRPTKRNQVVIHSADCPLRGEGSVPVPTLLLPHLAWEKDVVYPHRQCCPELVSQPGQRRSADEDPDVEVLVAAIMARMDCVHPAAFEAAVRDVLTKGPSWT